MSAKGLTATILWTQLRQALVNDAALSSPDDHALMGRFLPLTTGPETKSLTNHAKSAEWFVAVKMHNQFDHWT